MFDVFYFIDAQTMLPRNLTHLGCFLNRRNTYILFSCEGEYTSTVLLCYYIRYFVSFHIDFFSLKIQ